MGRRKPAWLLQRQYQRAQAREQWLAANPPQPPENITSRDSQTVWYYSVYHYVTATEHALYKVEVDPNDLGTFTAAKAGVLTAEPTGAVNVLNARGIILPTRVFWYMGAATPKNERTRWGEQYKWARYYDNSGDKSHHSVPFSQNTATFTIQSVIDAFNTALADGAFRQTLLGARNGRCWLRMEEASFSYQT
jgi:hypothetical protein